MKDNLKWRISTDEMIAVELKAEHKMIGNIMYPIRWTRQEKGIV